MMDELLRRDVSIVVQRPSLLESELWRTRLPRNQAEPAAAGANFGARRWTFQLARASRGEKFGARLIYREKYRDVGVMEVTSLEPNGLLAMHNEQNPDAAVEVNDVILAVNGVQGDYYRMLEEFEKNKASVIVERPPTAGNRWKVTVKKDPMEKLGALLTATRECRNRAALRVCEINAGPLYSYNSMNPAREVKVDDLIVSVNGQAFDP